MRDWKSTRMGLSGKMRHFGSIGGRWMCPFRGEEGLGTRPENGRG